MNYTEFKNGIENGKTFSAYLFEGEDAFFRERGLYLVKKTFISESQLNIATFAGDKIDEKEVSSSLSAYPFLSLKRLTVIREYYPKKDGVKGVREFLENPTPDNVLCIVNEKPSDVLKKFSSVCVVDCKRADANLIGRYVKGKCAQAGINIDLETAKVIADYCLCDMTRVESETEKLIAYCFNDKQITKVDVDALVAQDTEHKIYEMTDCIGKKNFDKAITVIYEMLSKGETMQRLLLSVYNYFRRLLHVAISNKPDDELAKVLGVKEYAVKIARTQSKAFKKKALKQAVDMLADTDYLIKSGKADADDRIWHNFFSIITG